MGRRSDATGAALEKASDQVASPVSGRLFNRGPSSSLSSGRLQTGRSARRLEPLSISAAARSSPGHGLAAARYSWLPRAAAGHCSGSYVPVASQPDFVDAGMGCNAFMTLHGLDCLAAWSVEKEDFFCRAVEEESHRETAEAVEAGRGGRIQILEEATASNRAGGNRGKLASLEVDRLSLCRTLTARSGLGFSSSSSPSSSQQGRRKQGPLKCRRASTPLDGKISSKRVGNRGVLSACGVAAGSQGSSKVDTTGVVKYRRGAAAAQIEAIVSLRTKRQTRSVVELRGSRWQQLSIRFRLGKESIMWKVQEVKAPRKCSVDIVLPAETICMKQGSSHLQPIMNEEDHGALVPYSDWMHSKQASRTLTETCGCTNRSWDPAEPKDKSAPQLMQVVECCAQPLVFSVEKQRLLGQGVETLFVISVCSIPQSLLPPELWVIQKKVAAPDKSRAAVVEVRGLIMKRQALPYDDDKAWNVPRQAETDMSREMDLTTAMCDDDQEAPQPSSSAAPPLLLGSASSSSGCAEVDWRCRHDEVADNPGVCDDDQEAPQPSSSAAPPLLLGCVSSSSRGCAEVDWRCRHDEVADNPGAGSWTSSSLMQHGVQSENCQVETEIMGHRMGMNGWVLRVAVALVRRRWIRRNEMKGSSSSRECPNNSPHPSPHDEPACVRLGGGGQWEVDGVAANTLGSRVPSGGKGILGPCIAATLLASSLVYLLVASSGNPKVPFSSTQSGTGHGRRRTKTRTHGAAAMGCLCVTSLAASVWSLSSSKTATKKTEARGGRRNPKAVAPAAVEAIRPYRGILLFLKPILFFRSLCSKQALAGCCVS